MVLELARSPLHSHNVGMPDQEAKNVAQDDDAQRGASVRWERARWCPSPNFNARPPGSAVELIVIHNISLPPGVFGGGEIEALFCNRLDCRADPYFSALEGLEVSAHFLVDRVGAAVQFVDCSERAWHAGLSHWCGREDCNSFSVGIELEGTDRGAYSAAQYLTLVELIRWLRSSMPSLAQGAIVGHSDIAPGRKTDPGDAFDWRRLRSMLRV